MPPSAAYQLIHDEMNLDGNPVLNLATFVTTWMEPEARKLIAENTHKNYIDHAEYPMTQVIEERCVTMLAKLFNAPAPDRCAGTRTVGSSEAIMLGLLAAKWRWKEKREAQNKSAANPNLIMSADVHTVWEKFARYFDVEARIVPLSNESLTLSPESVAEQVDENTICVGAVLGTTYTGQTDPIRELNDLLLAVEAREGLDIPIHVDAASGGFVTPFVDPELQWDFRLSQVKSINVSGHKFGLVYPGLGWLVFRDESELPDELVFKVNYLGGEMPTYTLNFSLGGSMVLAQYYNFLRLGIDGYRRIVENVMRTAGYVREGLTASGRFEVVGEKQVLPTVVVKLKDPTSFSVYDLSCRLRQRGWIVPAYTLPPNAEDTAVLRIVVKENFSRDMGDLFLGDVERVCSALEKSAEEQAKAHEPEAPIKPIC